MEISDRRRAYVVELGENNRRTFNVLRSDVETYAIDYRGTTVKIIKWFASGNWPAICLVMMVSMFIAGEYGKQAGRVSLKAESPLTSQDYVWATIRMRHNERMAEKNKTASNSVKSDSSKNR